MNIENYQDYIKKSNNLLFQMETEDNVMLANEQDLELLFYAMLKKNINENNSFLLDLVKIPKSFHFKLVKLFLEFGLYEQLIKTATSFELEHRCIKLISDTFKERLVFDLTYIRESLEDLKSNIFYTHIEDNLLFKDHAIQNESSQYEIDDLFIELTKIDFNQDLSNFSNLYNKVFSNKKYRSNDFFKARKPVPFILKNYPHYIYKICELEDDFSLYEKIFHEKNSFLSDIMFIETILSSSSEFYDSLSVASVHKLVRIFGIDYTVDKFRKTHRKNRNLIIDLFISQLEIKRSRQKTGYIQTNSTASITSENTAICISGQLRGGTQCLPFWLKNFSSKGYKTFISTWDKVGYPTGAEANRLLRMTPKKLHSFFCNLSVDEFIGKYKKSFEVIQPSHNSKYEINNLIRDNTNSESFIEVLYNDEEKIEELASKMRGSIPRVHLNQIKMFYNMKTVVEQLNVFEEKQNTRFEWIIWARPDFKIEKLDLTDLDLFNYVYSSRISDEGRMLDYCLVMKRSEIEAFVECFHNLISPTASPIFGYNHGPRLITDAFLIRGYSAQEIPKSKISSDGLKAWIPSDRAFYLALLEDLNELKDYGTLRDTLNFELENIEALTNNS